MTTYTRYPPPMPKLVPEAVKAFLLVQAILFLVGAACGVLSYALGWIFS